MPIGRGPFRRILYATDFSPGSEHALRHAASLAQHGAAQLTLLHAVEPLAVGYDPIVVMPFDVTAYQHVARGSHRGEILRIAAERPVDLIVLGVHGRSALDRLVFGSTTEHVVRRATFPVLTVREDEQAES